MSSTYRLAPPPRPKRHLPRRRTGSFAHHDNKPILRPSLLHHRGDEPQITDDSSSEDNSLETGLSDVEGVVGSHEHSTPTPSDGRDEGDEVDNALISLLSSPSPSLRSPAGLARRKRSADKGKSVHPGEYGNRKGVKRPRIEYETENSDEGDDEGEESDLERMEVEDEDLGEDEDEQRRRWMTAKRFFEQIPIIPPRPISKNSLIPSESIFDITQSMNGLAASAQISDIDEDDDEVSSFLNNVQSAQRSSSTSSPSPPSGYRLYSPFKEKKESSDVEMLSENSRKRLPKRFPSRNNGRPRQRITSLVRRSNPERYLRRRCNVKKASEVLTASDDPFLSLPSLLTWRPDKKQPLEKDTEQLIPMEISDVEDSESLVVNPMFSPANRYFASNIMASPTGIERVFTSILDKRFKSRTKTSRTRQSFTSHLRRSSPTSLFPLREYQCYRSFHDQSSNNPISFKRSSWEAAQVGREHLAMLRKTSCDQRLRRDQVSRYNERNKNGEWRLKVGKWAFRDQILASIRPWWLAEEEVEVEGLLQSGNCDGVSVVVETVDQNYPTDKAVSGFTEIDILTFIPAKREHMELEPRNAGDDGFGMEVSERWARRNQLRLELEVKAYSDHLQALQREHEERERQARIREEVYRARASIEAEERENERRLREETAAEEARLASVAAAAAVDGEAEEVSSEPPEYGDEEEFPFYPIGLPRPRHFPPLPGQEEVTVSPTLPDYRSHRHQTPYNARTPSPPPPFNAITDRQTLIAPVFIESDDEDSEDEDDVIFHAPVARRHVVGAFPLTHEDSSDEMSYPELITESRNMQDMEAEVDEDDQDMAEVDNQQQHVYRYDSSQPEMDSSRSFDASLDLEEGIEPRPASVVLRPAAVLGQLGRYLGGWFSGSV